VGGGRTNIYNIWKGFGEDEKGKKEIDCSSLYFSEKEGYIRRRSRETQIIKVYKLVPAKLGCFEK
jgi:hypothetical protein